MKKTPARAYLLLLALIVALIPGAVLASTTLTGVPASAVVGSYVAPTAGDFVTGSSIQVPVQGLANDLATLRKTRFSLLGGLTNAEGDSNLVTGEIDLGTGTGITISGTSSDSGVIRVQTSTAHGLQVGDAVHIVNVTGTTEANGDWVVCGQCATGLDATHFDLANSLYSNAYVSGGTVARRPAIAYGNNARTIWRKLGAFWTDGQLPMSAPTRGWTLSAGFPQGGVMQNSQGSCSGTCVVQTMVWPIDAGIAPHGAELLACSVSMSGSNLNTSQPATMPAVHVYGLCFSAAGQATSMTSGTTLASQSDTWVNSTAYKQLHSITATLATQEILDHGDCRYWVTFTTEAGANSLDSEQVYGAECKFSTRNAAQF